MRGNAGMQKRILIINTGGTLSSVKGIFMENIVLRTAKPSDADKEHISEKFHARMGYSLVGRFRKSGYKFDTWYDMIWMEKAISVHCINPPAVKSFPEIEKEAEKIY